HMVRPVPSIGERIPGLPAWLAGLVTIMLAKRRDERPASMHEVARALGERTKATQVAQRPERSLRARPAGPGLFAVAGVSALAIAVAAGGMRSASRRRAARGPGGAAGVARARGGAGCARGDRGAAARGRAGLAGQRCAGGRAEGGARGTERAAGTQAGADTRGRPARSVAREVDTEARGGHRWH